MPARRKGLQLDLKHGDDQSYRPTPASWENRISLVSSFWRNNIGNNFFNHAEKWLLEQVFGEPASTKLGWTHETKWAQVCAEMVAADLLTVAMEQCHNAV